MNCTDFNTWWNDFLVEPRICEAKDGGFGARDEINRYIALLSPDLRTEFIDELVSIVCDRSKGSGVAFSVLEKNCTAEGFSRIASYVSTLSASTGLDDQSALSAALRVLAGSDNPRHRDLLKRYLLVAPIGVYWTSVPWALWPRDMDMFARSWTRYFSSVPATTWRDTVIVQAFLSKSDAIVCVRDVLQSATEEAWGHLRMALLKQIDRPWLKESEREQLKLACGNAG